MRLLDRYLLRELLVPLGYCLSGFLLLWITADLFNELGDLQEKRLRAGDIAEYSLVRTPAFICEPGLPVALLLAMLYTLTNHSRHNEITAIRAAGVSLWRLCLPYLGVGVVSSLTVFALNELWVPDSVERAELIKNRRMPALANMPSKDKVLGLGIPNERDGRRWYVTAYNLRTAEMLKPVLDITQPDGSHISLKAERAVRDAGVWTFYNASEDRVDAQANLPPIPMLRTNVLAKPEFLETPEQIKSEIKMSPMMNTLSLRGAKKADVPLSDIWNYIRLHPQPRQAALLYTKLHGRLASPWTCLVVVLIAVPFGAVSGRRNVFAGVASSILIFLIYYGFQQLCLAFGSGGYIPPWLAGWFPNLAFGLTGICLMGRVR